MNHTFNISGHRMARIRLPLQYHLQCRALNFENGVLCSAFHMLVYYTLGIIQRKCPHVHPPAKHLSLPRTVTLTSAQLQGSAVFHWKSRNFWGENDFTIKKNHGENPKNFIPEHEKCFHAISLQSVLNMLTISLLLHT